MSPALKQAEAIFDALDSEERAQFCEYIAPWIINPPSTKNLSHEETIAAWERIKQLGAEMDEQAKGGPLLSEILTEMRNSRY